MSSEEFFSGIPVAVDPERIERELSRLWKPHPDRSGAVTRACLSNLIFHFPDASARDCASVFLPELGRRFPSRRILIVHRDTPDETAGLSAWLSAVCHVPAPGASAVCCEQIVLEAPQGRLDLLPGAVLPLLVPDVPVILVLLFPGGEVLSERLAKLVDRVVVDTRFRPLEALRFLAHRMGPARGETDDLAWHSILPWRRLVADLFDEETVGRRAGEIREVRVRYWAQAGAFGKGGCDAREGAEVGAAPAALLGGWLLSRLGWRPVPSEGCGTFRRGDARCALRLQSAPQRAAGPGGAAPAEILRLEIAFGGGGGKAELGVDALGDSFAIRFETAEACILPRRVPLRRERPTALLGAAVERVTSQAVLRDAVEAAVALVEA